MASTYSTSLKLELIGQGEQSGTWGVTTNNNFGNLVEQAITGVETISMSNATYTLTNYDGALDEARNAVLVVSGTNLAPQNVIAPSVEKLYTIRNISGANVTIKTASGNGVVVTNNAYAQVYCDSVDFYNATPSINNVTGNLTVSGNANIAGNATVTGTLTAGSITGIGQTIRQIVPSISYTASSTTSSTAVATPHIATITTASASSKVLVLFYGSLSYNQQFYTNEVEAQCYIYRNGTLAGGYGSIGIQSDYTQAPVGLTVNGHVASFSFVDSPGAGTQSYQVYIKSDGGVNTKYNGTGGALITLLEIL
jgi:hypothetical protein